MPTEAHTEVLLTIVTAVSLGTILTAVARKANLSAIVLLLLGGVIAGPEVLGLVKPESLQNGLRALVSFSIGLILFEGGLTLDIRGYRVASGVILRLLTLGLLVTWFGTAACLKLVFNFPTLFCLTAASLVVVTGPTVMVPILKRIRIQSLLHNILHWEAVLIDPIGVFVAVLCFEYIGGLGSGSALAGFAMRAFVGLILGIAGGFVLLILIRKRVIGDDLIEMGPLAMASLVFGVSEVLVSESGLLATTVAGLVLGASRLNELKQVRHFKGILTDLLIGMLFILLAARLNMAQFATFGWKGVAVVALVMFVVRPLNILASTLGQSLDWRQKAFLSWVAPRGIVAASMSSLVALSLEAKGVAHARFIESFTYAVIVGTVVLQGSSAGWLAGRLRLRQSEALGWLIVGTHLFGRRVARFIHEAANVPILLLDSNPKAVQEAITSGLPAMRADARDTDLIEEQLGMEGIGNLLAITDNEDLNTVVCQRWVEAFGANHVYGWHSETSAADTQAGRIGSVVWADLPKPSIMSSELDREMMVFKSISIPAKQEVLPEGSLIAAGPKRVWLNPDPKNLGTEQDKVQILLFERQGSHLLNTIRPDLYLESQATTLDELLDTLIDRLVGVVPRLSSSALKKELLERENVMPSSIGHGVAIPHAYSRAMPGRLCAVARLKDGLNLKTPDNQPVRLVFLLIGPPGDPEGHLALLAEIARLAAHSEVLNQLLNARSYHDLSIVVRNTRQP